MLDELQLLLQDINWLFEPKEHLLKKKYTNTHTIQENKKGPRLLGYIKCHKKSAVHPSHWSVEDPVDGTGRTEPIILSFLPQDHRCMYAHARTHTHAGTSHQLAGCVRGWRASGDGQQRFFERTFSGLHRDLIAKPCQ